jgi:hypothetical protein
LTKELFEQIFMENDEIQYMLYVLLFKVYVVKKVAVKTLKLSPSVPVLISATNINSLEKSSSIVVINNISKH